MGDEWVWRVYLISFGKAADPRPFSAYIDPTDTSQHTRKIKYKNNNSYHARALLALLDLLLGGDASRLAHAVRLARRRLQLEPAATAAKASSSSSRGPSPSPAPTVPLSSSSAAAGAFDWDALQVRRRPCRSERLHDMNPSVSHT